MQQTENHLWLQLKILTLYLCLERRHPCFVIHWKWGIHRFSFPMIVGRTEPELPINN